ncbi:reprolysin-like metallopeptidase [Capnocytophaga leadbetteri]|uniref:reprolysin-like metallopeptidase n=1 Tax=Capnocytophaga leadbetteri TaxID=327575 RepID=UPI0028D8BA41|nr:M12 family metallo-peptidase [Capnocytophaga leadbetteri]
MKAILYYCCALVIGLQAANAQQKTQELFNYFSQPQPISWAVSLPNAPSLPIKWQERKVTSQPREFRSFVGYYQDHFVGVITLSKEYATGEIFYQGNSYLLETSEKGVVSIKKDQSSKACGVQNSSEKQSLTSRQYYEGNEDKNDPPIEKPEIYNSLYPDALIHTDGVFRHYRLALPVDYSIYNSKYFNRDVNKVKAFWYATIAFVNELYRNDVGVDFTLVDDEALIFTTEKDHLFRRREAANEVVNNGTISLNKRYDPKKYDLAVILTDYREKYNGLAMVYSAYEQHNKANAAARPIKPSTIAHEMGHMFGADHTFSNGGQYSSKTEIDAGQSIMSYGHEYPRDFFSLISLETIRRFLGNSMAYYADEARTQVAGKRVEGTGSNLVYGVKSNNQPPVLDRSHLKKEYVIPKDTYFQFYLTGKDAENDTITYIAHQADRRFHSTSSNARFMTYKGKTNGNIRFETTWFEQERNTFVPIAATSPLNYTPGVFTFWLAAADHNRADRNHVVKYDVEEVKVKIAEGKPFQIQNFDNGSWEQNRTYNGGQLLTLHWQVDENIFGKDSKVRILLSDDSGKTYKYILKEIADNNGTCDVILPNINIGTTHGYSGKRRGQGVIKIEVIDGLAFALSCTKPYHVGGFMIDKNKNAPTPLALVASSLPAQHITVACANAIPTAAKIETQGGCGRVTQAIAQEETNKKCDNYYTLKRTYTFSDECNTIVSFEQFITVKDDKAPAFVGLLPKDVSIEEGAALPEPKTLTAEDNCAGNLQVTPLVSKENNKVVYLWKATDSCGNSTMHTQTILINPKPQISTPTVTTPTVSTPTVSTPTVSTPTVTTPTVSTPTVSTPTVTTPTVSSPTQGIIIYNGVSTTDPANYFRIENTDTDQPISVVIFDEMGLKVYENNNYGKTEVFRGMANVGMMIGGRKALAGTYFYIITYYKNGQLESRKGYLYVR